VFERADAGSGNAVVVAVNRGRAEATATVPAPSAWQGGAVAEVVTGETAGLSGGQLVVSVPARQARVYVRRTTG
jgi:hypothetical protein